MEFEIGLGGPPDASVSLATTPNGLLRYEYHPGRGNDDTRCEEFAADEEQLQRFRSAVERLCTDWEAEYTPDIPVMDGTRWSVEIHDGDLHVVSTGDNAFPDSWDTFLRAVRELAGHRWFD